MFVRQLPREIPGKPEEVCASAMQVFAAKCADCHDGTRGLPFYARLPGPGALIQKDVHEGLRRWDLSDKRHLGAAATAAQLAAEPVPPARLVKLRRAVADNTMPPLLYRAAHWGTRLSVSEKQLLNTWAGNALNAWLARWGIKTGGSADVQPLPDGLPFDAAKAALGERLYHDKRLSKDSTVSCATCHALDKGGTDNLPFSVGVGGQKGGVNAPTVFNAAFHLRQFWDGRAAHLAAQAGGPPLNPVEMASATWGEIAAKLNQDADLKSAFSVVYPQGFSEATICEAIAEYEKRLITPNSRFDKFLKGDKAALNTDEKRGHALFVAHRCATCHAGPAMGGLSFEYADLKADPFQGRALTDGDRGLAAFSKNAADERRFKVPTLRNVALTAPYLHDGSRAELKDAVATMMRCQVGKPASELDVQAMTAFLGTLTGELFGKAL